MNGRSASKVFFSIFFLIIIVFLQLLSKVQSNRFSQKLDSLEKVFLNSPIQDKSSTKQLENYPGDEGDWLVWAMSVEPKTLNLISVNSDIYARWMMFENVFEPLLAYDYDEVKLRPLLAKSYAISPDGLDVTFTLRDDIHFSDGVPITADDVIFTYHTVIDPKVDAADLAQLYVEVKGIEKIDEKTVRFTLKRPYFKSLEILSLWDIGIYPKHIYDFEDPEAFNKRVSNPIGSGPYIFEKWDVGDKIVFRRNENYWGVKPKIEKVIYKFIVNDRARLQALQTGNADMIIPAPEQYVEVIKDANFTKKYKCLAYWTCGTPFFYIGWNEETPFFSDRRVRVAMTEMLDRKALLEHLLKNSGKEITGPYYLYGEENDPNIQPWPYDPQEAGRLLDEAGWKDSNGDGVRDKNGIPFRFKFSYAADYILYQNLANVLKDSAAKVGIELIGDPVEWSVLITRITDHKFEAMIMGWGGDILEDQYQIFHSSQIDNRGANYVGFRNAEADRLLEQIRRTLDEKKRIEMSRKFHGIVHYEQPYTFLFTRPTYRIIAPRFENVIVHKLGLKEEEWFVPKNKQKYK